MADESSFWLNEALDQLPVEQREVILLHLLGGMTFREIGIQQGVSINTVQGRYRYGIQRLRNRFKIEAGHEVCGECRTTC